jgi:hypothetical protein
MRGRFGLLETVFGDQRLTIQFSEVNASSVMRSQCHAAYQGRGGSEPR